MKEPLQSDRTMRRAKRVCKNERKQVNNSQCQGACVKVVENKNSRSQKGFRSCFAASNTPSATCPILVWAHGLNRFRAVAAPFLDSGHR